MRMGRALALICVAAHLEACSLLLVQPAPGNAVPGAPVACTDSHTWPWIDAIYGLAFLSSAVGGGASDGASSSDKAVGVPVASLLAVGAIASAYVGFRRVGRCQELEDAYNAQFARQAIPPAQPYYPPVQQTPVLSAPPPQPPPPAPPPPR